MHVIVQIFFLLFLGNKTQAGEVSQPPISNETNTLALVIVDPKDVVKGDQCR